MKALHILLSAALLSAATAAHAHVLIFGGPLEPEGGGGRTGTGFVRVEYEEEFHALTIDVNFEGLSGTTSVAHIHCCTTAPEAGTAGVAIQAPSLTNWPVGVNEGNYLRTFVLTDDGVFSSGFISGNGGTKASAEAALLAALLNPGGSRAYFNIHTNPTFTGGEIRAFLNPIPEPATVALMLAGLGAVGFAVRRRR
jgi:hypothetical protein